MPTYTMFWPQWMCVAAQESGLEGKPLRVLSGGHNADTNFARFKVGPGDTVIPIGVTDGVVRPLAAIEVQAKTEAQVWFIDHPGDEKQHLTQAGGQLLVGKPLHPLRFDRTLSREQMEAFRFDAGKQPRPIKHLIDGKIRRTLSIQGVYRVTDATASTLLHVLASPPALTRTVNADVDALMTRMFDKPSDPTLARLLADAWQEQNDPRGQILALELALFETRDEAQAEALDEELLTHANKRLTNQPGGFPFRRLWGARAYEQWNINRPLRKHEGPLAIAKNLLGVDQWTINTPQLLMARGKLMHPKQRKKPLMLQSGKLWLRAAPECVVEVNVLTRQLHIGINLTLGCPVLLEIAKDWLKAIATTKPSVTWFQRNAAGDRPIYKRPY